MTASGDAVGAGVQDLPRLGALGDGESRFPHLASPIIVGPVRLRNRAVMLPMGARLAHDGTVGTSEAAWSEERSKGGVGLIIAGGALVHPTSFMRPGHAGDIVEAFNRRGLEGQVERVSAVHRHGAKIFGQLLHLGREVGNGTAGGLYENPLLAPSALRSPRAELAPRAMDLNDIREIVRSFSDSAALMLEAQMDGVEIHAAHGYLVAQFLSKLTNRRTDAYGAQTLSTRMRFLLDILEGVRLRCGSSLALGVRLSATEEVPGGLTLDETKRIAEELQRTEQVDYLSITVGVRGSYVKDSSVAPGVAVPYSAAIRSCCDLPVLVGGRITSPQLAEKILADGAADLVGFGRALIADARLISKAFGHTEGRIRPCIGIVQDCRLSQSGVTCAINASAGRESKWGDSVTRSADRLRVTVVGGGPAGLEAARVGAAAGHDIILYEREAELGGQLLRAARAPHRDAIRDFVDYLVGEVARLSVEVICQTAATPSIIDESVPDLVILATGASPAALGFDTTRASVPVISTWDLLDGTNHKLSGDGVIIDDGSGFWEVCGAAEHLAATGVGLTFVTPASVVGRYIPHESALLLHQRLKSQGVRYQVYAVPLDLDGSDLRVRDVITGSCEILPVDFVVAQAPTISSSDLVDAVCKQHVVKVIGDAVIPRRLTHAILDANRAIREARQPSGAE